jgi:trigger factor
MNITRENIDQLNATIKVKLGPEDYKQKVDDALKNYSKKVSMPGFRPGKVPAGMVKKMYGKSILAEELNKLLNDSLYKYIQENNIEMLGNPIPSADEKNNIDENQTEFEFKYDLGLAPTFNVELNNKEKYPFEVIKIDEKLVDRQMNDMAKRYGKIINPENSTKEDLILVDMVEVNEQNEIVAAGLFRSASLFMERITGDAVQQKLIGIKKDDKVTLNATELAADAEYFATLLKADKEKVAASNLQLTVKEISRIAPADINQELFKKIYGEGVVNNVEEFRAKLKEDLGKSFVGESDRKFMNTVVNSLKQKVNLQLPDEFLKRWLLVVNEKPISKEQLEQEYPLYAEQLKWQLIENKIIKEKEIKITQEEAIDYVKNLLRENYLRYGQANVDEKELNDAAKNILSKEDEAKRIFDQMYEQRLLAIFKNTFTLEQKEVEHDEFIK